LLRFLDHTQTHTHTHTQTHTHTHTHSLSLGRIPSERVISPTQRPLTDYTKQTPETNIHTISEIRTLDRSNRAVADLRLRLTNALVRRISKSISRIGNASGATV
jgi:hypothetical protein